MSYVGSSINSQCLHSTVEILSLLGCYQNTLLSSFLSFHSTKGETRICTYYLFRNFFFGLNLKAGNEKGAFVGFRLQAQGGIGFGYAFPEETAFGFHRPPAAYSTGYF